MPSPLWGELEEGRGTLSLSPSLRGEGLALPLWGELEGVTPFLPLEGELEGAAPFLPLRGELEGAALFLPLRGELEGAQVFKTWALEYNPVSAFDGCRWQKLGLGRDRTRAERGRMCWTPG